MVNVSCSFTDAAGSSLLAQYSWFLGMPATGQLAGTDVGDILVGDGDGGGVVTDPFNPLYNFGWKVADVFELVDCSSSLVIEFFLMKTVALRMGNEWIGPVLFTMRLSLLLFGPSSNVCGRPVLGVVLSFDVNLLYNLTLVCALLAS